MQSFNLTNNNGMLCWKLHAMQGNTNIKLYTGIDETKIHKLKAFIIKISETK